MTLDFQYCLGNSHAFYYRTHILVKGNGIHISTRVRFESTVSYGIIFYGLKVDRYISKTGRDYDDKKV